MHVLFDLNGTLTDAGALTRSWPGAPRAAGLRALDDAVAQAMVDVITGVFRPFPELLRSALGHEAAAAGLGEDAVDAALAQSEALPPFPDAGAALAFVAAAGAVPSVLSNSAADAATASLRAAGIATHVDTVIGADVLRTYKPDPRLYAEALAQLAAPAGETWMVAAHWWDVAGAKRAGLRTAWVSRDEGLLRAGVPAPDVVAPDLAGAVAAIV